MEAGRAKLRWEWTTVGCLYLGYAGPVLCRTTVPIAAPAMIADPALGLDKAGPRRENRRRFVTQRGALPR